MRRGTPVSLALVPSYGMRYLAKVLKTTLAEKFPDAGEAELHKASADPAPPRPTCTGTATLCGEPQEESVPQPATRPWLTGRAAARRGQRAGADGSQPRFAPRRRSGVLWDLEQVAGLLWVVSSSVK